MKAFSVWTLAIVFVALLGAIALWWFFGDRIEESFERYAACVVMALFLVAAIVGVFGIVAWLFGMLVNL